MVSDRIISHFPLLWCLAVLLISRGSVCGEVFDVKLLSITGPGLENNHTESTWQAIPGSGTGVAPIDCTVLLKHLELSEGIIKYTWSINVQNLGTTPLSLSLTLILMDGNKEVLHASTIDPAEVPAGGGAVFFQSEPIRESEWVKVADHEISIVSN